MVNGTWQADRATTVLVVNDEAAIRSMLREMLQLEGFQVETAEEGRQALAILRRSLMPRVMLLDDIMPVMGGQEVLEALATNLDIVRRTACVYLNSRPESVSAVLTRLLTVFNASVLAYPFTPEQLLAAIEIAAARLPLR